MSLAACKYSQTCRGREGVGECGSEYNYDIAYLIMNDRHKSGVVFVCCRSLCMLRY